MNVIQAAWSTGHVLENWISRKLVDSFRLPISTMASFCQTSCSTDQCDVFLSNVTTQIHSYVEEAFKLVKQLEEKFVVKKGTSSDKVVVQLRKFIDFI